MLKDFIIRDCIYSYNHILKIKTTRLDYFHKNVKYYIKVLGFVIHLSLLNIYNEMRI